MSKRPVSFDVAVAIPHATPAREAVLAGLGVLLVHALVRIWVAPGAFDDDAVYLALGKAIASGQGWHSIYAVGSPVHVKYPPALPAIYAVLWWIGGSLERTLGLVHAVHLMVAGACGAFAWWIVRARLGGTRAAAAIALVPLGLVAVVDHWQLSTTEGPFVAAWLAALMIALGPLDRRRALTLGILLAVATLLRTQGVALIGGVLIALALTPDGRRHLIATGAAAVVPVLVWSAAVAAMARHGAISAQPNEAGYLAPLLALPLPALLRAVATGIGINVSEYWRIVPRELGPAVPGQLIMLVCAGLAFVGAARDRWRIAPVSLTVALSIALLLVLPYNQERYIVGILPVVALLVVHGWPVIARRVNPRVAAVIAVAAVAIVMVRQRTIRRAATSADPVALVGFEPIGHVLTRNTAWLEAVAPWVAAHTPPEARILTEGAPGVWLATGRVGVAALPPIPIFMSRPADDPNGLAARLVGDSITVVIASSAYVSGSVNALERQCPGTFQNVAPIGGLATAIAVDTRTQGCLRRVVSPSP